MNDRCLFHGQFMLAARHDRPASQSSYPAFTTWGKQPLINNKIALSNLCNLSFTDSSVVIFLLCEPYLMQISGHQPAVWSDWKQGLWWNSLGKPGQEKSNKCLWARQVSLQWRWPAVQQRVCVLCTVGILYFVIIGCNWEVWWPRKGTWWLCLFVTPPVHCQVKRLKQGLVQIPVVPDAVTLDADSQKQLFTLTWKILQL